MSETSEDPYLGPLLEHIERRPLMRIQDLYKMRHQGAWGPGYVVSDRERAWRSFEGELNHCDPMSPDPVIEILSPRFCRVNLGPYKRKKYSTDDLFNTWLSGTTRLPDGELPMSKSYEALMKGIVGGRIPFDAGEIEAFENEMCVLGYPALSHTEQYMKQYRPHYRVVLTAVLPIPMDTSAYKV